MYKLANLGPAPAEVNGKIPINGLYRETRHSKKARLGPIDLIEYSFQGIRELGSVVIKSTSSKWLYKEIRRIQS